MGSTYSSCSYLIVTTSFSTKLSSLSNLVLWLMLYIHEYSQREKLLSDTFPQNFICLHSYNVETIIGVTQVITAEEISEI